MRSLVLATIVGVSLVIPAHAGGVLLCSPYGCRSSPYFPPPIFRTGPPVVYLPPPVDHRHPVFVAPRFKPAVDAPRGTPQPRTQHEARRQEDNPQAKEIEGDIMDFCDQHPEEKFCGKLGTYLRKHNGERQ